MQCRSVAVPSLTTAMNNGLLLSPASEKRMRPAWSILWIPIPGAPARRLRIPLPNLAVLRWRLRRKRAPLFLALALALLLAFLLLARLRRSRPWSKPSLGDPHSTLVFHRKDLQTIWSWEITSGHYPSFHPSPSSSALVLPSSRSLSSR